MDHMKSSKMPNADTFKAIPMSIYRIGIEISLPSLENVSTHKVKCNISG